MLLNTIPRAHLAEMLQLRHHQGLVLEFLFVPQALNLMLLENRWPIRQIRKIHENSDLVAYLKYLLSTLL
jgi:hypothetical protein